MGQHRVQDLPGALDLGLLREQRLLAEQHVEDEPFVGLGGVHREGVVVGEVHRHVAHLHRGARDLGAEPHGHPFVGLDAQHHGVAAEPGRGRRAERGVRGRSEDHGHLGDPAAEPLAGAQVERDAGPAAGGDVQPQRRERVRRGPRVDAVLLQVPRHRDPALPAGRVLAVGGGAVEVRGQLDRLQDALLLPPHGGRVERVRVLHRHQGEQLQQVVLDDVARRADPVVVAGAAADADVLGHRDLHVVHVPVAPHRLEDGVREPDREDVLHRLLAEVVVDPEDRRRVEACLDDRVELTGRGQVVAERLLHHDPAPGPRRGVAQAGAPQVLRSGAEGPRRDREVEGVVAAGAALGVELVQRLGEAVEGGRVVDLPGHEADALAQLRPHLLLERGAGVRADRVVDHLREVAPVPVAPSEADEREARREQPAVVQVVDGRHHLRAREVAGHPEHDQRARPGEVGHPAVAVVAQRVAHAGP
jgi:hypothetical protein